MARTSLQPPPFLAYDTWSLVFDTCQDIPAGLLVVIFPEETLPSWSRCGAPHPATAVMRTTLIAERKENIYSPPFLKTPRAPRIPPTPVGCFVCAAPTTWGTFCRRWLAWAGAGLVRRRRRGNQARCSAPQRRPPPERHSGRDTVTGLWV